MSWNKNTISFSELDAAKRTLDSLKASYQVSTVKEVEGMGLNDYDNKPYLLRRLVYADTIILEKMIRHSDCDVDDIIVSQSFPSTQEPKDWIWEEFFEDEGIEELSE